MPYRAQFMNCASWGPGRSQPIARKSVRNWHQQRRPKFRTMRVTRRVHRSLSSFCPERAPLKRPAIVSTFSRPPCAAGGILAEFNRRAAVGLTRLATGQAKAKNQTSGSLQQRICRTMKRTKSPHWFECRLELPEESAGNGGRLYLLLEFLNDNLTVRTHLVHAQPLC